MRKQKSIKSLLTGLLAVSILCTPVFAADHSDSTVYEVESYNLSQNSEEAFENDSELIRDNSDDISYIDEINFNTNDDSESQLPHALSNISPQAYGDPDYVAQLQIFAWVGYDGGSVDWAHSHSFLVITNRL